MNKYIKRCKNEISQLNKYIVRVNARNKKLSNKLKRYQNTVKLLQYANMELVEKNERLQKTINEYVRSDRYEN